MRIHYIWLTHGGAQSAYPELLTAESLRLSLMAKLLQYQERPHTFRLSLMVLSVPLSRDRCPDTWDTVPYISPQRLPDGAHSSASDRQRISVFRLVFLWQSVWYFCGKSQTCPTCPTCLTFKAFSPFLPLLLNRMSQVP